MAYHGPSYGLSRECQLKAQSKFDLNRALEAIRWVEQVTEHKLEPPKPEEGFKDQLDVAAVFKDGITLCTLINRLHPAAVKKINTTKAPFKQRENLEMFLRGCENYGLKSQDLFQVNDLYEHRNLYTVIDCLFALGGLAQKKGYDGPSIGVKVADENKRMFSAEVLAESNRVIGLQYGSNKGATQAGMTAYGMTRQIKPEQSFDLIFFESLHLCAIFCLYFDRSSMTGPVKTAFLLII
uniref:Transgelin n=1 Tax=Strigamia maritima TaxID=126957 RepID=T1INE2_STRMM